MPDEPNLSAEELATLLRAVDRLAKKRRIQMWGYLGALIALGVGMLAALVAYGMTPRGWFMGWVFLVPPGLAGGLLWAFGRWARSV